MIYICDSLAWDHCDEDFGSLSTELYDNLQSTETPKRSRHPAQVASRAKKELKLLQSKQDYL
jgi:hypothetical protein